MAHFAELKEKTDPTGFTADTHLIVERVIVVDNAHVESDEHVSGENWCSTFLVVEIGNKLLIMQISEKNMLVKEIVMIPVKINL